MVFFFFKQKTAYEIKECDWSSDVCSSDLEKQAKVFPLRLASFFAWKLIVSRSVLKEIRPDKF